MFLFINVFRRVFLYFVKNRVKMVKKDKSDDVQVKNKPGIVTLSQIHADKLTVVRIKRNNLVFGSNHPKKNSLFF